MKARGTPRKAAGLWGSRRDWIRIVVGLQAAMLVGACGMLPWLAGRTVSGLGEGTFESNGERIYLSATSDRSGRLGYSGGPLGGGMMTGWRGLACVSCHGADGRGGVHVLHMSVVDAPDIRWLTLAAETGEGHSEEPQLEGGHGGPTVGYDLEAFRLAVVEGEHPDGTALSLNMPRWDLGDEDLADLAEFLRSLP